MKKLVLLLLLVSASAFCQVKVAKPLPVSEKKEAKIIKKDNSNKELTEKEYNYLTSGIAIQQKGGFDMIAGYEFYDIKNKIFDNYIYRAKAFIKTDEKLLKAILIEITNQTSKKTFYLALPAHGESYTKEYINALYKLDPTHKSYLNVFLSDISRVYYNDFYDTNKK